MLNMAIGKSRLFLILIAITFVLMACNLANQIAGSSNEIEQQAEYTAAAQTIVSELTQNAAAVTTSPATDQATKTSTPSENQPTLTPEKRCHQATFVSDVTIPDGTTILSGETFTKTWRLLNSGTCAWTSEYRLVFKRGDIMDGESPIQFTPNDVEPDEAIDIMIELTAPDSAGTYQGHWMLQSKDGEIFGLGESADEAFWVEIRASASGGSESSEGIVYVSGQMEFGTVVATADLDEGIFAPEFEAGDVILHPNKRLEPRNSALIAIWGAGAPSFSDCANLALSSNPIIIDETMVGKYLCYRTNLGKPGFLYITQFSQLTFNFDFVTWKEE
jgi:hypothetical protein